MASTNWTNRPWRRCALLPISLCLLVNLAGCGRIQQTPLSDAVAVSALTYAMGEQGAPYALGGQGPDEFDCSGLVIWAYKQAYPNTELRLGSRTVADVTIDEVWRYNVLRLTPDDIKPGDIVFITKDPNKITHGGMFVRWTDASHAEFEFVNASSHYGEVVVDTWPATGEKRGQKFVGAGRLQTVY